MAFGATLGEAPERTMKFGSAWYPEQWEEARWPLDLALMRDAGMNVVRVGEFAWSRMEPEEGRFDLDWLERAVALAAVYGLKTVMGTPTAAPPAWLTRGYPETLLVREDGRRATHGNRCHFSPTSARYLRFCEAIAGALAGRFGSNPNVVLWQIDNEYSVVSYDEEARRAFQEFLRGRFGTLEALNAAWTTAYWSQTYAEWSEVPIPVGAHHPGLALEFRRFVSHAYARYQRVQIDAIRAHGNAPITHNALGWFEAVDLDVVFQDLDVASWDSYVGSGHLDPVVEGAKHDLVRGLKRQNFWLMETQPGSVNWAKVNNALDRGEVRTMAWHAVGHGADAVLYWQWRSALGGQEQYHGSLLGPDGLPRPVYGEVARLGVELARASSLLDETQPVAEVAILDSHDDRWALLLQKHHADYDPSAHLATYYRPLRALVHTVDVVHPGASFEGLRLIVAPHLHAIGEALARSLEGFVRRGGVLVLGPRSGVKDENNRLLPSRQPGPLASVLGAHVEEYFALDVGVPVAPAGEARIWAEWLETDEADAAGVLHYGPSNGWLDGKAAVVERKVGQGMVVYVGAWLDGATMARLAAGWVAASGADTTPAPEGVELCRRIGAGKEVWICINHGREEQRVPVPFSGVDVLTGRRCDREICLRARDVAVIAVG